MLLRDDVAKARTEEMAWNEKFESPRRGDRRNMFVKNGTQNPSPVDGETSTKVTANVWKCEVDWSRVRSNRKGTDRYFAGTPPLAIVRNVISRAAKISKTGNRPQLMVPDAKRAFLQVDALTETYCENSPYLRVTERCWLLKKFMYGTLPAVAGWQHLVQKVGADIGLLSASNCPCAFGHTSRDSDMVVHGDDFIVAGRGDDLDRLSQKMEREASSWRRKPDWDLATNARQLC